MIGLITSKTQCNGQLNFIVSPTDVTFQSASPWQRYFRLCKGF